MMTQQLSENENDETDTMKFQNNIPKDYYHFRKNLSTVHLTSSLMRSNIN